MQQDRPSRSVRIDIGPFGRFLCSHLRGARAVVARLACRRPSVDGAAREAAFVVVAWNLALCVRMEPLLALLIARCAQFVAPTRSTVIQPMATKALVSTPAAAAWFRAAGDSAQWMLPAAAS